MSVAKLFFVFLLFFSGLLHFVKSEAGADEGLVVVTGIAPYTYLAERIGGSRMRVRTFIDQSRDPHTFEPSPQNVHSLGEARLFFLSGLDFEKRLTEKIQKAYPSLVFVNLNEGLNLKGSVHKEEPGDNHGDFDQHVWLSPPILRKQAEVMASAFANKDPAGKEFYYGNLKVFQEELDIIVAGIAKKLKPFSGRTFYVFHPAFAHFGEAFGLHQKAVESGGRLPTPKSISTLIASARDQGARVIFVQPQFDQASARIVASSIAGKIVVLDPLAKDVLRNYAEIAEQLERAFQ